MTIAGAPTNLQASLPEKFQDDDHQKNENGHADQASQNSHWTDEHGVLLMTILVLAPPRDRCDRVNAGIVRHRVVGGHNGSRPPALTLELRTVVRAYNYHVEGFTTAQLAREEGVNVETIRYYERHGLLPKAPRTASGYRQFSEGHAIRLRFIRRAQELGFTLKEIEELLAIRVKSASSCADVRRKAEAKIAGVDEKIRHLQAIREALFQITATCSGRGPATECSILEALNGRGDL